MPFAITSPTPAAVKSAPRAAKTCGKSPTGPTLSISLVPSFTAYSFLAPVTKNTTIKAIRADNPTALFAPSFFQTVAISHALSASTKGAINILFPSLSALALVSVAVGTSLALCPTLPIAVSNAIRITQIPVTNLGAYGPAINVKATINQKTAVVFLLANCLSLSALSPTNIKTIPIHIKKISATTFGRPQVPISESFKTLSIIYLPLIFQAFYHKARNKQFLSLQLL